MVLIVQSYKKLFDYSTAEFRFKYEKIRFKNDTYAIRHFLPLAIKQIFIPLQRKNQQYTMPIKQTFNKYIVPFIVFTTMGVLAAVVLRKHTSLSQSGLDVYLYVMLWTALVPNIIGFGVLLATDWITTRYPIYYLKPQRLWWNYAIVAITLVVTNYATIVLMRYMGKVPDPFVMSSKTFFLILYIWFVEMIVIGMMLFYRSILYTNKILKEKQKLEDDTAAAQYEALQQQLNPHFLFNSLNTLIAEIEYDPAMAVRFTEHLSDIYRYVLKVQKMRVVPLTDELVFLQSYLFLHQVRLGDCITLDIDIPDDHLDQSIPPLTLQMLAENVIKHNVISEASPITISLSIDKEESKIVVSNNIHPKLDVPTSGQGLKNLNERYRLLCKQNIDIIKTDDSFSVRLPILTNDRLL